LRLTTVELMSNFTTLPRNRFFEAFGHLNVENRSDNKVAMLTEIDLSSVERLRAQLAAATGTKPSYTALVAKAVARALRENPHANRIPLRRPLWTRIVQLRDVDVSVAVERNEPDIDAAVFVATLRNTDSKDLGALTAELRDIAQGKPESCRRWQQFRSIIEWAPAMLARFLLSLPCAFARLWIQHRGGAALISSPAKYGVDMMIGTWPWPLAFSFGLVKERPVVVAGQVVVRPTMTVTMSFDRRLLTGAVAARFFNVVCGHLEQAQANLDDRRAEAIKLDKETARNDTGASLNEVELCSQN
jgi:pyruvate/2-oxoglutarate dehydrogenase complex dihydrolipoamide acyltransferase (E2) component